MICFFFACASCLLCQDHQLKQLPLGQAWHPGGDQIHMADPKKNQNLWSKHAGFYFFWLNRTNSTKFRMFFFDHWITEHPILDGSTILNTPFWMVNTTHSLWFTGAAQGGRFVVRVAATRRLCLKDFQHDAKRGAQQGGELQQGQLRLPWWLGRSEIEWNWWKSTGRPMEIYGEIYGEIMGPSFLFFKSMPMQCLGGSEKRSVWGIHLPYKFPTE